MTRRVLIGGLLVVGVSLATWPPSAQVQAQPQVAAPAAIDADDIGGVVTSANGPEAGVWVIAETQSLPTGFRKIVVTDDLGRYVVPDLPKGEYTVWVRGYGLVDSQRVKAVPGQRIRRKPPDRLLGILAVQNCHAICSI